ncbi:MAG: PEGA domain-containing protein [Myxococcota bacterium]|jgi:hypothetical protein|nr:PEGA domain-containing protein [Myxococcota bacterium]
MQLALSGFMHSLGVTFDSISLSELMHSLFQTGADSSSAVYQVINERPHEQPAPMMTDQRFPPPPVDEDAQTSVYDRDHIGGIVDQIDALYGAESPPGAPRRAELPDVHRPVDIAIDRSIYQVNTVITDLEGQPISPSKPRPPMLLFLLALSGIVLLAWAFIFATNQLVLGRSPSSAGPVVQGAGQRDAVHIDSTPSGAVLWLDGKDTGLSTPAELMGISEGEHQISLRLPFHEDYDSTLQFKAGAQFTAELKAKRGILKIDSVPPGAQIHVDGFFVGPAPVNVSDRDMAVPHRVAASLDGYKDLVTTAQWQRDEPILTVSLKLSRAQLRFPDVAEGCLQGAAQAAAVFAYPRSQALPQPVEPAEPQTPSDEVDEKPDKEHKKPVSYGSISVQSKPPGTLYIDGKNTGMTTPVRALRVTAGYHDIKILDPETGTFSQEKRTLVRPSVDVKLFFRQ